MQFLHRRRYIAVVVNGSKITLVLLLAANRTIGPHRTPGKVRTRRRFRTSPVLGFHIREQRAKLAENIGVVFLKVLFDTRIQEQTLHVSARDRECKHVCAVGFLHGFEFPNQ